VQLRRAAGLKLHLESRKARPRSDGADLALGGSIRRRIGRARACPG